MLEPILCGPVSRAPLLPKLRGHFAEFLNDASPVGLGILSPSTCVGLRYGRRARNSGFSWHPFPALRYFSSLRMTRLSSTEGFSFPSSRALAPVFSLPGRGLGMRPRSSDARRYWILRQLSVGYAFRPRLRPRLTQGRSALPWKPWTFGRKDSHLPLATHSGILPSRPSTAPCRCRFPETSMLPYQSPEGDSLASASGFSPGHFRRGTSRPVSYYALFERVAASEPTSWLSSKSHILFHLTCTLGP